VPTATTATFVVPPSKASIEQNRFFFTVPRWTKTGDPVAGSERTYSFPKLQYLPPKFQHRVLEAAAAIPEGQEPNPAQLLVMWDLQIDIAQHYVPGFVDLFQDGEQMGAVFEAWQASSGISLGESSASPTS
jgi:hypothetical protein